MMKFRKIWLLDLIVVVYAILVGGYSESLSTMILLIIYYAIARIIIHFRKSLKKFFKIIGVDLLAFFVALGIALIFNYGWLFFIILVPYIFARIYWIIKHLKK